MPAKKKPQLTEKQKKLAEACTKLQRETVINIECHGMNQTDAYIAAGGKAKKPETQRASVSEILTNPKVIAFRDTFITQSLNKAIMTREEALELNSLSARVKITDICDFKNVEVGKDENDNPVYQTVWVIKNSEEMEPWVASCIKSVGFQHGMPKIELHDQMAARRLLAEMQGWNAAQKFEHTGKDGEPMKHDITAPEIANAIKDVAKLL